MRSTGEMTHYLSVLHVIITVVSSSWILATATRAINGESTHFGILSLLLSRIDLYLRILGVRNSEISHLHSHLRNRTSAWCRFRPILVYVLPPRICHLLTEEDHCRPSPVLRCNCSSFALISNLLCSNAA